MSRAARQAEALALDQVKPHVQQVPEPDAAAATTQPTCVPVLHSTMFMFMAMVCKQRCCWLVLWFCCASGTAAPLLPGKPVALHTCSALCRDDTGKAAWPFTLCCSVVPRLLLLVGPSFCHAARPLLRCMPAPCCRSVALETKELSAWGMECTLQLPIGIMCRGSRPRSLRSCGLQMKGLVQAAALHQPLEHLQLCRRIGRLPVSLEEQMPQVRVVRAVCVAVAVAAQLVGSWCSRTVCIAMQLVCSW